MKKFKNIISGKYRLILILVVLFTVSCSESFLELQPQQSVSTDQALNTIGDFRAAITGCYDGLSSSDYYGRYFILVTDIMSDDVKQNASANRASDWAAYAGSKNDNNALASNIWSQGYSVINRANNIIAKEIEVPVSVKAEYDNIKGQAYAIRALAHFDLVRIYAQHYTYTADASHLGVPIITDLDPFYEPSRNTVKQVYDQVIADFTTALGLISNDNNAFILTKSGVNALLSRVYLYKEDWPNTIIAANAVINSNMYSLVGNGSYATIFSGDKSAETIFEIDMNPTDRRGTDAIGGMYLKTGYGDYLPSRDLINLIPVGDARHSMFSLDPALAEPYASHRVAKYSNPLGEDNTPVVRLAEVILNRAEAYAHTPNQDGLAQDDLDLIRKRGLPTAADATAIGPALLDEILLERRIELCFEGHRLWDLTRNKKGVVRTDCTSSVCSVTYPNNRFILAIGGAETDVNIKVDQNPGY